MDKLPDIGFGGPAAPDDDVDLDPMIDMDDDEELSKTPKDVIEILGFDPKG